MKLFILLVLVYIILLWYRDVIETNIIVFLTVKRGIVVRDCFWWRLSEHIGDTSGLNIYNRIKSNRKIVNMTILNREINIIVEPSYIQQLLDNSPHIFGVGSFKYDFFKTFMPLNVGISEGCPWKRRREFNEVVLDTERKPQFIEHYRRLISKSEFPIDGDGFSRAGKKLAMQIVFGLDDIEDSLFELLTEANSIWTVLTGRSSVLPTTSTKVIEFLNTHMNNPIEGSLLSLMPRHILTLKEVQDQIPHWIFPIAGVISNGASRLLLLLSHYRHYPNNVSLRSSILEMFRLNNPVNSTFRSLLQDYSFDSQHTYKKGTQFLVINNPVMRDADAFPNPNQFDPDRWTPSLENSYNALMFNQGPQKCPGKEFVISLLEVYVEEYTKAYTLQPSYPHINLGDVPQAINPCSIIISRRKSE